MCESSHLLRFALITMSALLLSTLSEVSNASGHCPDDPEEIGRYGYNPDPEGAYIFGLAIKQLVEDRDLAGLFNLVEGELRVGPRKRFIENRTCGQVFTEDWRSEVLASEVSCFPVGWRGFTLANGAVWYRFDESSSPATWEIFRIGGAIEEEYSTAVSDPAWRIEGRVIPPECLVSGTLEYWDKFEAYADIFGIADLKDFRMHTGHYFGREIDRVDPINSPWGGEAISLAALLDDCLLTDKASSDSSQTTVNLDTEDYVLRKFCEKGGCIHRYYRLLTSISPTECRSLAPHLRGSCESAYLVERKEDFGGTIVWSGVYTGYNIYGLFSLEDGRKAIVPLVYFNIENDARNFLDEFDFKR